MVWPNPLLFDFGIMANATEAEPVPGALAGMLEELPSIRRALLRDHHPHFTKWPNQNSVGVKSMKAMALNPDALLAGAHWWCPLTRYPRPLKIGLRDEVGVEEKKPIILNDALLKFCLLGELLEFNTDEVSRPFGCLRHESLQPWH